MCKLLLFSVFFFISGSESAKILGVFPIPSISHQVVFRPLMLELARRGHEVTVITTDPAFPKGQTPHNFTEIDIHDVSYSEWMKIGLANRHIQRNRIQIVEFVNELILKTFEVQLNSPEIRKFLRDDKQFDLLIYESCVRPALIFSHVYNIPAIEFSSLSSLFSTYEMIGAASHPLIYPGPLQRRIYNLTLWEKVTELYVHYSSLLIYNKHEHFENEILKKVFGPNIPSLNDLSKNVLLSFFNVHPLWDFNRPVPPNVLYLGGMHQKPVKELPKELKSYLDSSKNGVIYMSFGTNVVPSLLPPEKIKIFTDVFSRLPYDIIWKWDKEELPGRSENIRISKWLPQSDLLRHPKVKLFITQGGLQSTDEALTAGVPLIGIPAHGDQWFNTEHYVKFNIGVQLCIETLTEDKLRHAIDSTFDNSRFQKNIVTLRKLMNDQPQTPLVRAVWWTEYLLRHGGNARLRTPAAGLSWSEFYELNLVLLFLSIVAFSFIFLFLMISLLIYKIKLYTSLKVKVN